MSRILIFIVLIYLVFRFIRNITFFTAKSRPAPDDDHAEPASSPKPKKMIKKDEGEYVDFEEVKK